MEGGISMKIEGTALVVNTRVGPADFAAIYDHYFSRVYTYIRYRVGDAATTDDLTAQVFERTLTRIDGFNPERASFSVWLFAIARNAVNDHLRSQLRHPWLTLDVISRHANTEVLPEEHCVGQETRHELLEAMAQLDEREIELIALKFTSGLTNRHIARIMRLSEKNVSVILYRTIRHLREILKKEE